MEYIKLKNSDLTVSRICMGGCPMGGYGWGTVSEVTDLDGKLHALDCIMRQYHSEDFYYDPAVAGRTRILCLKIQERTGKRRAKILGGSHHA